MSEYAPLPGEDFASWKARMLATWYGNAGATDDDREAWKTRTFHDHYGTGGVPPALRSDTFDPRKFRVVTGLDWYGNARVELLCERETQTDMMPPFRVTRLSDLIDAVRRHMEERHG
jgi:hypothetical protein